MNYARSNNADTTAPYPCAEGGYHAYNTLLTSVEVGMGTKYIHHPDKFSSGTSSNDWRSGEDAFLKYGGIRFRETGADTWNYRVWYEGTSPVCYNASAQTTNWDLMLTSYAPKWQCMESQMGYSWGQEFGISENTTFQFYGAPFWFIEVATGASVGLINSRVYKIMTQTANAYNTSGASTSYDVEVALRDNLANGFRLSGDIWEYWGGGYEQVGINNGTGAVEGAPIHLYLEPDQTQWVRETNVQIAKGNSFSFESKYRYLGEYKTMAESYSRTRVSYTNRKIVGGGSIGTYECHFMRPYNAWDTNTAAANLGRKTRAYAVFRGVSNGYWSAARSSSSHAAVSDTGRSFGGSAQFLIQ
jgi:hypothetical protein